MELKPMTIETVGGGVLPELFEHELARVLANIADPNTPAKKPRTITLQVTITPHEQRQSASLTVKSEAKLAGTSPPPAVSIWMDRENPGDPLVAFCRNPNQRTLPFTGPQEVAEGGGETC